MSKRKTVNDEIPVSFRLPSKVQTVLLAKARQEDLNFSQFVRRALRRELVEAGIPEKEGK